MRGHRHENADKRKANKKAKNAQKLCAYTAARHGDRRPDRQNN